MINVFTIMMGMIIILSFILKGNIPNTKSSRIFIIISCILMFVVLGFRDCYTIGNDSSSSYLHIFQELHETPWADIGNTRKIDDDGDVKNTNIGFYALMKFFESQTSGNYQYFIVFIALLIMIALAFIVTKYSVSPLQSFIYFWGLLLYSFHFNSLKQSVAMALILFSFDALVNKRLILFVGLVLLASLFHFPSLIFLPAFFVYRLKMGRAYLIVLMVLLAFTYSVKDRLVALMTQYYGTDLNIETGTRFIGNKVIIMIAIITVALILRPPTEEDKGDLYNGLLSLMGVATLLQTFASYNNTFERLADYYFQFAIIFIPLIFEKIELKKNYLPQNVNYVVKTFFPVAFCLFCIWRFADDVQDPLNHLIPYSFGFKNIL